MQSGSWFSVMGEVSSMIKQCMHANMAVRVVQQGTNGSTIMEMDIRTWFVNALGFQEKAQFSGLLADAGMVFNGGISQRTVIKVNNARQ